jgi:hypothetical protein
VSKGRRKEFPAEGVGGEFFFQTLLCPISITVANESLQPSVDFMV